MQWPFLRSDAGPVPASLRHAPKQKNLYGDPDSQRKSIRNPQSRKRNTTFIRPDYDCVHGSQQDVQENDGRAAEDGVLDHDGDPGCIEDGEVQGDSVRQHQQASWEQELPHQLEPRKEGDPHHPCFQSLASPYQEDLVGDVSKPFACSP